MLNQLKEKLRNFMRGRYGVDALYRALTMVMLALVVLNLILSASGNLMLRTLLSVLMLMVAVLAMFRVFSKNHTARAKENQQYLAFKAKAKQKLLQLKNRIKDIKTHRYRTCPSCKQSLRLKKKVGINHVKCPRCKHEFDVNIRF